MATTSAFQALSSEPQDASSDGTSEIVGYVITFVACLLFGSCLLPAKKFYTGDGVFYQLMMNNMIIASGLVINIILGLPRFEPFVMISGAMWCTANLGTILTIRCIGLGIGMNMWSLVNLVVGWAAGRFGFFGPPQVPRIEWLQYLGIAVGILRGIIAAFITPVQRKTPDTDLQAHTSSVATTGNSNQFVMHTDKTFKDVTLTAVRRLSRAISVDSTNAPPTEFPSVLAYVDTMPELREVNYYELAEMQPTNSSSVVNLNASATAQPKSEDFIDRLSLTKKRILGICIATFCGLGFGLMFEPVNIMKQNGGSLSDKDYLLSIFAGALLTSMLYSTIYIIVKRNRPFSDGRLILPAFSGGLMWAVGQIGRLISHEVISQSVSFPIYSAVPALISLMWGFFVFKEIQGRRNVILFVIVAILTVASVLMVSFSK